MASAVHASRGRDSSTQQQVKAAIKTLKKRAVYVVRLAYWTARHRSLSSGRWVVAYEGHSWN